MAKFAVCLLFAVCLAVCSAQKKYNVYPTYPTPTGPAVSIEKTDNMTPSMQLDASNFLKRAYSMSTDADRCRIFRDLFAEKYTQYQWHVVLYRAYSVKPLKSIVLRVGSGTERFFLFATKK